jgi:transcriptional regulator with XRE-family HTH domain
MPVIERDEHGASAFGREFGGNLRDIRAKRGLSLREACEKAHISATGLLRIERGVRDNPKLDTLMAIAEALNVKIVITHNAAEVIDLGAPKGDES